MLGREGEDSRILVRIYVAVVEKVFLYGSDMLVMTPCIGRDLVVFHHRVSLRMTGRQTRRGIDRRWVYPPLTEAIDEAVLQEVGAYISRRQNTSSQFIATRTIMDLCLEADIITGSQIYKRWWEQEGLYLERMRTVHSVLGDGMGRGGRGDRGGVDRDGRLIIVDHSVANVILVTEPNDLLAYDPGLELHHPIMTTLGGNEGRLEREIFKKR